MREGEDRLGVGLGLGRREAVCGGSSRGCSCLGAGSAYKARRGGGYSLGLPVVMMSGHALDSNILHDVTDSTASGTFLGGNCFAAGMFLVDGVVCRGGHSVFGEVRRSFC